MKCHEIVELLSEYLDGELDVGSRSEVDGHLAVCESCQRELHQLKATISLVASLPKATAPAALAQRVGEEAQDEMQAAASKRRLWYLFPALAAAAAVLIAIQIAPRRTPPTPETEWNSLKTLSSDEIAANMRNAPARETVPALRDLSEMDAMADSGKPKREQFAKEAGRLVETVGAGGAAKADDALRQIAVPSAPQAAMPHFRTEESPRSLGSLKLVSESYVEAKKVQPTPAQEAERPAEAAAKPSRDEERVIVAAQNMAKAREAIENALKANRLAMEPVQGEPDTFRVTTLLHSHDRTLIL
ncbi:MAG: hypothetical protein FJ279_18925, partial [Planctomycetes bacterium]|nr:hypothetical protein [Planctomycetota bacterium]